MRKTVTITIIFFSICICLLLQGGFFSIIKLYGTSANIGIIFIGSIGLICGPLIGALTGGMYGLFFDITFARTLGIYTGLYLLIGVLAGILNKGFSKESRASWEMLIAILTSVFEIMVYVILMLTKNFEFELHSALFILIKEIIYNTIIVLMLFKPLSWFGEMINKSKNSYYLL